MRALLNPSPAPERVRAARRERGARLPPRPARLCPDRRCAPCPARRRRSGWARCWLKDENGRFGLPAFKISGASWALERLLAAQPGLRAVWAASEGNHGRAVARAAAQRGLAARIFLPARTSQARADAIAAEGAEIVRVDGHYEQAVAAAAEAAGTPGAATLADVAYDASDPVAQLGLGRLLDGLRRGRRAGGRGLRRRALPDRRRRVRSGGDPLRLPPGARPRSRSGSSPRPPPARWRRSRPAGRWSSTRRAPAWPGSTARRPRMPPGRRCATASRAASRSPMPRRTPRCAISGRWAWSRATAAPLRWLPCAPSCAIRSAPSSRAAPASARRAACWSCRPRARPPGGLRANDRTDMRLDDASQLAERFASPAAEPAAGPALCATGAMAAALVEKACALSPGARARGRGRARQGPPRRAARNGRA